MCCPIGIRHPVGYPSRLSWEEDNGTGYGEVVQFAKRVRVHRRAEAEKTYLSISPLSKRLASVVLMRGRLSNTMKFPIRERHRRKISKCSADVVLRGKRVNAVTCDAAETHPGEDKIACTM